MDRMNGGGVSLRVDIESFKLKEPFHITGQTMVDTDLVTVTLGKGGRVGRGEASGVYYRDGDDALGMVRQIEGVRSEIEAGVDRESLRHLLRTGGARNALDCALWDLEAKLSGRPAWQLAGLDRPQALLTTFTVGANSPEKMASDAVAYAQARAIKMKLTGEAVDAERVRAVRHARPDVWLGVDGNQGIARDALESLMPTLIECRVELIEQPFRVGEEALLDGLRSPIAIAADESAQGLEDVEALVGRFEVVNIKLDKCGGLTEGLAMAREAQRLGLDIMVGNMVGTSLAMAPSCLIGQLCKIVDLDGPVFLKTDRVPPARYEYGRIHCPDALWGAPAVSTV